ncbi:MAG: hypothetical protein AAB801_01070, partial [Patescibacteria group bacterium]
LFENFSKRIKYLAGGLFVLYLLFTLRPAVFGDLSGIFRPKQIPSEYLVLGENLKNDKNFYRTLWVPQRQKYGYFDPNHPGIDASSIMGRSEVKNIIKKFNSEGFDQTLSDLSVKYVIVPTDSDGEIFLKDRKYDPKQYQLAVNDLSKLEWLKKSEEFEDLVVFETASFEDHFWSTSENLVISYRFVNPTEYRVNLANVKKGDILIFSEGYNPNWVLKDRGQTVFSKPYNSLNSFVLSEDSKNATVYFKPQKWVNIGLFISALTFLCLLLSLLLLRYRK